MPDQSLMTISKWLKNIHSNQLVNYNVTRSFDSYPRSRGQRQVGNECDDPDATWSMGVCPHLNLSEGKSSIGPMDMFLGKAKYKRQKFCFENNLLEEAQ